MSVKLTAATPKLGLDILKFESSNHAGEPRDDRDHLPWSQFLARSPDCASLDLAIVLLQASGRVRR